MTAGRFVFTETAKHRKRQGRPGRGGWLPMEVVRVLAEGSTLDACIWWRAIGGVAGGLRVLGCEPGAVSDPMRIALPTE